MTRTTAASPPDTPRVAARAGARSAEAFVRAERHSRRVGRLKFWLPTLSALAVAGFVAWSYLSVPGIEGVSVEGAAISDGKLVMSNPKLDGYTKDKLPYSMSALRAVQDPANTALIRLEQIDAKLPMSPTSTAKVVAQSGVYDNDRNTLVIDSRLTVTTTDGMVANLHSARVDMESGLLTSSQPVEIIVDGSRIAAESMKVSENGKVIAFESRVRVDYDPSRQMASGKPAEAADAPGN